MESLSKEYTFTFLFSNHKIIFIATERFDRKEIGLYRLIIKSSPLIRIVGTVDILVQNHAP